MKKIWFKAFDLIHSDYMMKNTIMEQIGIKITGFTNDSITGTMPVDKRTHQPYGILHGGASVVLAETLGSLAAQLTVDDSKYQTVGLEVNANHIKSVRSGIVTGIAQVCQMWTGH